MKKLAAAALALVCGHAQALNSLALEAGSGNDGVHLVRLAVQSNAHAAWLERTRWRLYWDLALGLWSGSAGTIADLGVTPVFRYAGWGAAYVDGAIGFHLLSRTRVAEHRDLSTRFQFGDHVGIGYDFGRYDVSLRLQHLSNAGLRNPNPGINFLQLRLQLPLR